MRIFKNKIVYIFFFFSIQIRWQYDIISYIIQIHRFLLILSHCCNRYFLLLGIRNKKYFIRFLIDVMFIVFDLSTNASKILNKLILMVKIRFNSIEGIYRGILIFFLLNKTTRECRFPYKTFTMYGSLKMVKDTCIIVIMPKPMWVCVCMWKPSDRVKNTRWLHVTSFRMLEIKTIVPNSRRVT